MEPPSCELQEASKGPLKAAKLTMTHILTLCVTLCYIRLCVEKNICYQLLNYGFDDLGKLAWPCSRLAS